MLRVRSPVRGLVLIEKYGYGGINKAWNYEKVTCQNQKLQAESIICNNYI